VRGRRRRGIKEEVREQEEGRKGEKPLMNYGSRRAGERCVGHAEGQSLEGGRRKKKRDGC
jgi:hypothetical protein